jgi:hypothetical protein
MEGQQGFQLLPWVVERLVCDYEQRTDVSEAVIHVAMGSGRFPKVPPEVRLKICKR